MKDAILNHPATENNVNSVNVREHAEDLYNAGPQSSSLLYA